MKTDGIAAAARALHYWERRQEVAANNLANANTTGFKAERIFARLMGESLPVAERGTDFAAGTLTPSANPLDLALANDAFLVVATPQGERLTRGGSFHLDPDGFVVDPNGNRLLGEKGAIRVTGRPTDPKSGGNEAPERIEIDARGEVRVDGMVLDRLRMESVPPGTPLDHEAGGLFVPDASRTSVGLDARDLRQGHLEQSNVSTINSLVDLISIQRNYANAQKTVSALDGIRSTIVNDLGKLA
jgi:flagellar basal body rod protein FlgG